MAGGFERSGQSGLTGAILSGASAGPLYPLDGRVGALG